MCDWYHFFLALLMLTFSISSIIIGLFAIYFSGGKTRIISSIFFIIGVIVFLLFLWFSWCLPILGTPPIQLCGCVTKGLSAFLGGFIGILCSIGFLLALILKS